MEVTIKNCTILGEQTNADNIVTKTNNGVREKRIIKILACEYGKGCPIPPAPHTIGIYPRNESTTAEIVYADIDRWCRSHGYLEGDGFSWVSAEFNTARRGFEPYLIANRFIKKGDKVIRHATIYATFRTTID